MKKYYNWYRILHILAIVFILVGTIDPLEGSVLIVIGSILLAAVAYLRNDRHRRIFLLSAIFIVVGVVYLFWISSLGGFGGTSELSWWWGAPILPYPIGWLVLIITLISRLIRKNKLTTSN